MIEKLTQLEKRYCELETLLGSPEIASHPEQYQKYAKEHSSLREIVEKFREYRKMAMEIQDLEEMLKRRDQEPDIACMAESELREIRKRHQECEAALEEMLIGEEPDSNKDVIMEIRAGTGGLEASLFAAELFRMYSRYAASQGWKVETLATSLSEAGGFKEIVFSISGNGVYRRLKYESGVHRVQRVPVTEASGRVHTSTVTVAVLPEAEEVDIKINPEDVRIDVFRSSGPGGQSVNTTDSAVRLTHIPTGLVVTCQDERSQLKNKNRAFRVLRTRLMDTARQQQEEKMANQRRSQIGTGDRSEKIRTYNFADRRITDHRIGFSLHNLSAYLEGEMEEMIQALLKVEKEKKLKQS
ncbi:MAG: peptide chain release factor 1 [Candidatus Omnitrophica bacterium]|nr:peptide chain release factor 1 [Candidatus Omnitrophota bacterium]